MVSRFHPAPGLGELMPGTFVVPQNPITGEREVMAVAGVGDTVRAFYSQQADPMRVFPERDCGCGCNGACQSSAGIGSLSDYIPSMPDTIGGVNTWYVIGGALFVLFWLSRGSGYRDEASLLRAKYRYDKAKLRSESPRLYARTRRSIQEALEA